MGKEESINKRSFKRKEETWRGMASKVYLGLKVLVVIMLLA